MTPTIDSLKPLETSNEHEDSSDESVKVKIFLPVPNESKLTKKKRNQQRNEMVFEIKKLAYVIERQEAEMCMHRQRLEDLEMGSRTLFDRGDEMLETPNVNIEDGVQLKQNA